MKLDPESCYRALTACDPRFDGVFFVGVTTTGIYCRPVCTARRPDRANCRYFATASAAEAEGFRPCLRCRPELAPGPARVDASNRIAEAAAARIAAGALNEGSVPHLASDLCVGERHLRRVIRGELGASPVQLAQTHRLLLAKRLLTDTSLPVTRVAFASGFSSVSRFNTLFRQRYRMNPMTLRRSRAAEPAGDGTLALTLAYRPPFAWDHLLAFLAARAIPGVEAIGDDRYFRTIVLREHRGSVSVSLNGGAAAAENGSARSGRANELRVSISLSLAPVLMPLLAGLKQLFDLDAAPEYIVAHLADDSRIAPLVRRLPGLRVPGAVDGFELALRAILGQQISVAAATTLAGRIAAAFGEPAETGHPELTRYPVAPERLAEARPTELMDLGVIGARAGAIVELARVFAHGDLILAPGTDVKQTLDRLRSVRGIGPWTAQYIAMRALHWPDAFPHTDLALRKALGGASAAEVRRTAERWKPWRAYAAMHLWQSGSLS